MTIMRTRFSVLPLGRKLSLIAYEFRCLLHATIADWFGAKDTAARLVSNAETRREYWLGDADQVHIIHADEAWMKQRAVEKEKGEEQ